jgi:hypothetical protein
LGWCIAQIFRRGLICALHRVNCKRAPFAASYSFSPILLACNRRCMGVNGKLKWLVQGGNYQENDSTLPRLLMAVYTPLLRCATASDVCNFACGLRTKQTGSCCQVPRFAFLGLPSDATLRKLLPRQQKRAVILLPRNSKFPMFARPPSDRTSI